jgi:hypothetical protein
MANHNPPTNGLDKRKTAINRKGRPKTFDEARALAQAIAHEAAKSGGNPIEINGHAVSVIEAIMRTWATSKDPRLQMAFIEYAIGKPPQHTEITGADGKDLIPVRRVEIILPPDTDDE